MNNKKIITEPGSSAQNKTGNWRTYRPVIDKNICISCSMCSKICPEACIGMKTGKENGKLKPSINYNYCKGCGLCAKECPVKAIEMEKDF